LSSLSPLSKSPLPARCRTRGSGKGSKINAI
jgi:hypothetical protein